MILGLFPFPPIDRMCIRDQTLIWTSKLEMSSLTAHKHCGLTPSHLGRTPEPWLTMKLRQLFLWPALRTVTQYYLLRAYWTLYTS